MNEGEPEGVEDKRSCPPIGPCQDPNLRHAHNAARSIRTAQASVCLSLGYSEPVIFSLSVLISRVTSRWEKFQHFKYLFYFKGKCIEFFRKFMGMNFLIRKICVKLKKFFFIKIELFSNILTIRFQISRTH